MIKAVFEAEIIGADGASGKESDPVRFSRVRSFEIRDHSGYSEEGSDIVCAAVSSMTMLTVNTLECFFGKKLDVYASDTSRGGMPDIRVRFGEAESVSNEVVCMLGGFYNELYELTKEYPGNIRLEVKNSERKNHA